ncbi:MAG: hypothetical protein QXL94_02215 [Candidatus Parvarchaeum sp.]
MKFDYLNYRGVDEAGNDVVIPMSEVQKIILTEGNNDYYGFDSSTGGIVGIGYG